MKTDHVIALLGKARDRAHRFIVAELNSRRITGLVPSHGAILSVLFKRELVSMKALAEEIGRDKSTVTALVKKLMNAGYVTRKRDPDDGRITYLCLTPKGKSLQPDFDEISRRLISRAFKGFSKKDREVLVKGLEKMFRNFTAR